MNTIKFLKNYRIFASQTRYQTAVVYLEELKRVDKPNNQKLMMVGIIHELVASTEDLAMWLVAISNRNDGDKRYRDIWERLLNTFIKDGDQSDTSKILKSFKRVRTPQGLLRKLDLPKVTALVDETKMTSKEILESLDALKGAIDVSIHNREVSNGVMVRTYNKIKHGMMVYLDPNDLQKLWIRDFQVKYAKSKNNKKRLVRKNREMSLGVNAQKAEAIVGTIKAISQAMEALIGLVLFDLEYRIKTGKLRMIKRNKKLWLDELNSGEL
jgi:hypothetical protein